MTTSPAAPAAPENQRALYLNGVFSQVMDSMTTGALLIGFAVHLGASHLLIGLIGAIPFLSNLLQLPAILLVDRYRDRRRIVLVSAIIGRSCLLLVAAVPLLLPQGPALALLILALTLRYCFGAFTSCAWNSWLRDILPTETLGRFLSNRLYLMSLAALLAGLGATSLVDFWPQDETLPWLYSGLFVFAAISGLVGTWFTSRIAHVPLRESEALAMNRSMRLERLRTPFRDDNFRRLISFQASWNFAANLATPFFVVYMLTGLGYELKTVLLLTLLSQAVCTITTRFWGLRADHVSHKRVMAACGVLFLIALAGWTFTGSPERHAYTTLLLICLHTLMGIATAGINLTSSSLALKLAPDDQATTFLAVNSMVNSLAAGIAPLIGGLCAQFFSDIQLSLILRWQSETVTRDFSTVHIGHWDFFFLFSMILGVIALMRLGSVIESGNRPSRFTLGELMTDAGQALRSIASADGLRDAVTSPFVVAFNLFKLPPDDQPKESADEKAAYRD